MAMAVTYTNFCGRIVAENRGGVQKTYVRDTLGNTVALLDENQNVTDTAAYWPYGEVAVRTGTTPTPLLYGGTQGYYSDILFQIYVRRRVLQSKIGNWTALDPLWPLDLPYVYVRSSPLSRVDPSGLFSIGEIGCCIARSGAFTLLGCLAGTTIACAACVYTTLVGCAAEPWTCIPLRSRWRTRFSAIWLGKEIVIC